jgi:hypothetical protein
VGGDRWSPDDLLGKEVNLELPAAHEVQSDSAGARKRIFSGKSTGFRLRDGFFDIEAHPKPWARVRTLRTRSFGGEIRATPMARLRGIASVLDGDVANSQLLDRNVEHLLQYEESDWDLLVRASRECGVAVYVDPTGKVTLTNGSAGLADPVELPELSVFRVESVLGRARSVRAASRSWALERGSEVQSDAERGASGGGGYVKAAAQAAPSEPLRRYGTGSATGAPDATVADRLSSGAMASMVMVVFRTDDPTLAPGKRFRSSHPALKGESTWLVLARELNANAQSRLDPRQFDNKVWAISATGGLPRWCMGDSDFDSEFESEFPAWCRTRSGAVPSGAIHAGRVTDTQDPTRRGRILVRFPWHGSSDSAVRGVWCNALQTLAGIKSGKAHGTWMHPQVDDWVKVMLDPRETGAPDIVGTVVSGESSRVFDDSKVVSNTETDHLILQTSCGIRLVARENPGELTFLVEDGGVEKARLTMLRTGDIELHAAQDLKLVVDRHVDAKVTGNVTTNVTGNVDSKISGNQTAAVTGNLSESVTGNVERSTSGNLTSKVMGSASASVTGSTDVKLAASADVAVAAKATVKAASAALTASTTEMTSMVTVKGMLSVQ